MTRNGTLAASYTYDALGNLTDVVLPDGTAIGYLLDAQNRRIGRTVNGVLQRAWLYQGQLTPVAELDGSGNLVSRFVYATGVNVPDYLVRPGAGGDSTYRLVRDHLGSVRLVVNVASGSVAQRIAYDEFGIETENTNPSWQPFGYAGGLTDSQTGLIRFGARDYDPQAGRWTAKDPIGLAGGTTSLYEYAANDPIDRIDISGLWSVTFAAYGIVGGEITFGRDAVSRNGFMSVRLGIGAGGGITFDPSGQRPGSRGSRDTSRGGFSIGEFTEAGGDLGPIDAAIEGSFGSTRYFGDPCEIFDYYSFGRPGLEAALEPRKW